MTITTKNPVYTTTKMKQALNVQLADLENVSRGGMSMAERAQGDDLFGSLVMDAFIAPGFASAFSNVSLGVNLPGINMPARVDLKNGLENVVDELGGGYKANRAAFNAQSFKPRQAQLDAAAAAEEEMTPAAPAPKGPDLDAIRRQKSVIMTKLEQIRRFEMKGFNHVTVDQDGELQPFRRADLTMSRPRMAA